MTLSPGDLLLNKYRVERLLGQGAFAQVYLVTHLGLNVHRALKVLRRDAPGVGSTAFNDYRARFRLEAQLGAQIESPHVIRIHDFEDGDELLALVMEYASGGSLQARLEAARREHRSLPVEECLRIAQEAAQGLAAIHKADAVHRDLKPSNILFDVEGRAKVADLGLAQVPGGPSLRSVISQGVPHPGTPAYMSPEQATTYGYLTSASDVYALGLILFEMLTGRMYRNVRPGTRVRDLRPEVPAWLDELVARMAAEDPMARPWDGAEAAEWLAEAEERARREAEERARREAEERARREAEERARREAEERARREAEERARREAEERARREAEEQARREAEERARREAEEQARREAEERARREAEERARREAEERARQEAEERARQQTRRAYQSAVRERARREAEERARRRRRLLIALVLIVGIMVAVSVIGPSQPGWGHLRRVAQEVVTVAANVVDLRQLQRQVTEFVQTVRESLPQIDGWTGQAPQATAPAPTPFPAVPASPSPGALTSPSPSPTAVGSLAGSLPPTPPPSPLPPTQAGRPQAPPATPSLTAAPAATPFAAGAHPENTAMLAPEPSATLAVAQPLSTAATPFSVAAYSGNTATLTPEPTPTPTVIESPTPPAGSTTVAERDGMTLVYVPAGEFLRGSADDDAAADADEKPQRAIYLDAFWIDQTEVTKDQYRRCVAEGRCAAPSCQSLGAGDHPVVCVSWQDAVDYCTWAGRRLPTEAEWEKAARGTDGRPYPWGDREAAADLLNFCDRNCGHNWRDRTIDDGYRETAPVGSYPSGASPYGVFDLAGNVWEWTADWYDAHSYADSSVQNPQGPPSGSSRVVRGGSWDAAWKYARAANRNWLAPDYKKDNLGFRCVRSAE